MKGWHTYGTQDLPYTTCGLKLIKFTLKNNLVTSCKQVNACASGPGNKEKEETPEKHCF